MTWAVQRLVVVIEGLLMQNVAHGSWSFDIGVLGFLTMCAALFTGTVDMLLDGRGRI